MGVFRVAMRLVEDLRVGEECAQAGLGAEEESPSAILGAGEVGGVGVAEEGYTGIAMILVSVFWKMAIDDFGLDSGIFWFIYNQVNRSIRSNARLNNLFFSDAIFDYPKMPCAI